MFKEKVENLFYKFFNKDIDTIVNVSKLGGMTNSNFLVETSNGTFILKLFGKGTEKLINREIEKKNQEIVQKIGLDVKNFVFDINNGVKINEYIKNAETLSAETIRDNFSNVAKTLQKVHSSNLKFYSSFNVFSEIKKYENLIVGEINYPYYSKIREKVFVLEKTLENIGLNITTCHIDLVPENFIKDKNNFYLIDWEYCSMNDSMWDISALFLEANFKKSEEKQFLSLYNSEKTVVNEQKILIFKILQDFLWSLWTIYKEEQGSDFGSYGIDRYNRALKNLKEYILTYEKK